MVLQGETPIQGHPLLPQLARAMDVARPWAECLYPAILPEQSWCQGSVTRLFGQHLLSVCRVPGEVEHDSDPMSINATAVIVEALALLLCFLLLSQQNRANTLPQTEKMRYGWNKPQGAKQVRRIHFDLLYS